MLERFEYLADHVCDILNSSSCRNEAHQIITTAPHRSDRDEHELLQLFTIVDKSNPRSWLPAIFANTKDPSMRRRLIELAVRLEHPGEFADAIGLSRG